VGPIGVASIGTKVRVFVLSHRSVFLSEGAVLSAGVEFCGGHYRYRTRGLSHA
jgi:hypothetical protein